MKRALEKPWFPSNEKMQKKSPENPFETSFDYFDSSFLDDNEPLANFDITSIPFGRDASLLNRLRQQYASQDIFWFDFAKIAFITHCEDISCYLTEEGLFDNGHFFQEFMKIFLVSGNQKGLERLLQNVDKFEPLEMQTIKEGLLQLFHYQHYLQRDLLAEELWSFRSKYPDEYTHIWVHTYPDYILYNRCLADTRQYLKGCLTVLQGLCSNACSNPLTADEILFAMRAVFSQKKYTDYLLPADFQPWFIHEFMQLLGLNARYSDVKPYLRFFIEQEMFIPFKHLLCEFDIFQDKEQTRQILHLVLARNNPVFIALACKLHDYYLLNADKKRVQNGLIESYKPRREYFAIIARDYPEVLDRYFNQSPGLMANIQKSFRAVFFQGNPFFIETYFKIRNFLQPAHFIPLLEDMTVEQLMRLYRWPQVNRLLASHPEYLHHAVRKNSPELLTEILEKYRQGKYIPDTDLLNIVGIMLQARNYPLLKTCLLFQYPLFESNEHQHPAAFVIAFITGNREAHDIISCLLNDPWLNFLLLSYVFTSGKNRFVDIPFSSPFFPQGFGMKDPDAFVEQCFILIENLPEEFQAKILKSLLLQADFLDLQVQWSGTARHVYKSSQRWHEILNGYACTDLECRQIINAYFFKTSHVYRFFPDPEACSTETTQKLIIPDYHV